MLLTCAIFLPTSELSRLDLPTFDLPRNATSGTEVTGNCVGLAAEVMNSVRTFTRKVYFTSACPKVKSAVLEDLAVTVSFISFSPMRSCTAARV